MNEDEYKYIQNILNEILIYLGSTTNNPISFSFLCKVLGFSFEERLLLEMKLSKFCSERKGCEEKIDKNTVMHIIEEVCPSRKNGIEYTDEIIMGLLNSCSVIIPELKEIIDKI